MGRLGGITDTLSQLLEHAGITLPPWAFPVLIGVAFLGALPWLRQNQRTHRARLLVAEIASERDADRQALKRQAIEAVAGHPVGLVGLADEALRKGLQDLAASALEELKKNGKPVLEIRRLQEAIHGPPPAHLEGELAAIEQLLSQGLPAAALKRVRRAQQHWPNEPSLHQLAETCAEE